MKAVFFMFCLGLLSAPGQILGAYESFSRKDRAISWGRVDFSDPDSAQDALWQIPGSANPEIYTTFNGNFEASLFADNLSSGAIFVGDYDAVGIDTVRCDVYVEDLPTFDELEIYLLAGDTFYYSDPFELNEPGWALIENSLSKDQWYIYDDDDDLFIPVELTPLILSDVIEIGVTFYPNGPEADGKIVAVDNFVLLPDLETPALNFESTSAGGRLSFTGRPGLQFTLQTSRSLQANRWNDIGTPFEAEGPFEINVPQNRKRGFFRLKALPFFVELE